MTKQKVKTEQLTTAMKTPGEQKLTMKETLECPQEGITKTIPSLRGGWGLGQAITNSNKKTVTLQPTLQLDHPPPPRTLLPRHPVVCEKNNFCFFCSCMALDPSLTLLSTTYLSPTVLGSTLVHWILHLPTLVIFALLWFYNNYTLFFTPQVMRKCHVHSLFLLWQWDTVGIGCHCLQLLCNFG